MKAARDTWINPVLALGLCTAGGALFAWLRTPLPWMIGPLLAMAAGNFAGARLRSIPGGRQSGQLIIGTVLGLYFTPVVAGGVLTLARMANPFMFGPLIVATVLTSNEIQLSSVPTWTSNLGQLLLGCAPGGIAEMCITAKVLELGVPLVTAAHVTRVLVLINATEPIYRFARYLRARAGHWLSFWYLREICIAGRSLAGARAAR